MDINLPKETCEKWGGEFEGGKCKVSKEEGYDKKTVVRNCKEGGKAFDKYSDHFNKVMNQSKGSGCAIFIPCGSKKPIGLGGDARKKAEALEETELDDKCDVLIISEPATIIPNNQRLTEAAVNYDFPPKYAKEKNCPKVFDTFTDRLAKFLKRKNYDTAYPYLISHHEKIFNESMDKADVDTNVERVPPSSYSEKAGRRISDRFATKEQIKEKLSKVAEG